MKKKWSRGEYLVLLLMVTILLTPYVVRYWRIVEKNAQPKTMDLHIWEVTLYVESSGKTWTYIETYGDGYLYFLGDYTDTIKDDGKYRVEIQGITGKYYTYEVLRVEQV